MWAHGQLFAEAVKMIHKSKKDQNNILSITAQKAETRN